MGARELEVFIRSWQLIPSSGGTFELTVNGELLFSKKQLGRHAEPGEILDIIRKKAAEVRPAEFGTSAE